MASSQLCERRDVVSDHTNCMYVIGTAQNTEPTLNSQAIDSQADAYNTLTYPESQSPQARNTRTGSDQHCDEQTSLLRSSTPCARSSNLGKQRSATIFSLLTSPRLPLACTATIVMAVITAALETVRLPSRLLTTSIESMT